jgi:hypothetical protein
MHSTRFFAGLAAAVLISVPASAVAQSCLGLPSFSRGPVNLRASYADAGEISAIGAGIQAGGRSAFGGASINRVSFGEFDESSFGVAANLGTQIPIGASQRAALCPIVEGSLSFGPDFELSGSEVELRSRAISAGLALGGMLDAGSSLHLIPNVALVAITGGTKLSVDGEEIGDGTDTYGAFTLGLGFLFSGTFAVSPYLSVPIGLDDSDTTFGVNVAFAFGSNR